LIGDAPLGIGDTPIDLAAFAALVRGDGPVAFTPAAQARMREARAVVDRYAAGDAPIYGLNTGLGGNLAHRLDRDATVAFQEQLIRGRCAGVGPPLPRPVGRAALLARIVGVATGGAGLSPEVAELLVAMFNAGIEPAIPARGSIGAGDLALCAHLGAVVIGRGEAWLGGEKLSGAEALARAGLRPATLAAKDGLGLINSSAVSVGHGALALDELGGLLVAAVAAAALAVEGYDANPAIFDPRIAAARPAPGQAEAAAWFRRLLAGSENRGRAIQDALCFRTLAPVLGAVLAAFDAAANTLEAELNAAADNPLVLPRDGLMLSTANFHTPALALAFDALAMALAQWATGSVYRVAKLMTPALSGLPRYLSPAGGASVGLNALQKTAAALHGEIRLRATPASLDAIPVSDTIEDHAPQTHLAVRKLAEQMEPLRLLVAVEALVAAQAVDLRGTRPGDGTLLAAVRAVAPRLDDDREPGVDVDRVAVVLDAVAGSLTAPALLRRGV